MLKKCKIDTCFGTPIARGWCSPHYRQWYRHGDPEVRFRHPRTKDGDNLCTKCKTVKPASEFTKRKNGRRYNWCRACAREYRNQHHYRLSGVAFMEIYLAQGKKCATCDNRTVLHIDHDHNCCPGEKTCGACVRGLLCPPCNFALGRIKDNPLTLRNLADYLESYERIAKM